MIIIYKCIPLWRNLLRKERQRLLLIKKAVSGERPVPWTALYSAGGNAKGESV